MAKKKQPSRKPKFPNKLPRKQKGPPWSFDFLGIPCGDTIEFIENGVFIAGRGEKFMVANQDRLVTCKHGGKIHSTCELKVFKNLLLREKNPNANTERWVLEYWIHCATQKRLSDIYQEKDRQITTQ